MHISLEYVWCISGFGGGEAMTSLIALQIKVYMWYLDAF